MSARSKPRTLAWVGVLSAAMMTSALVGPSSSAAPDTSSVTVRVRGTANIFFAQRVPPPGDLGTKPPHVPVQAGVPVELEALGRVGCGGHLTNGPDGPCYAFESRVRRLNGVSGYRDRDLNMVLVGVFTDGTKPMGPAPQRLVFADDGSGDAPHDFESIEPLLGQTFFIGDGYTGTGEGERQQFVPPAGATRLYLGFADANGFIGTPCCYADNVGTFTVTII